MAIGLFGPQNFQVQSGGPARFTPVAVLAHGTTIFVQLYADINGMTTAPNPIYTDQYGDLTFYAESGQYDLLCNGETTAVTVTAEDLPDVLPSVTLPWELANAHAGKIAADADLTPHPDNDPDNPITLATGTVWDGYLFNCSSLLVIDNTVKVRNSHVVCTNSAFGIRTDANTGTEHDRVFENCVINAAGVGIAGGSGLFGKLCLIEFGGDDGFRFGRTHTQGPYLEMCVIRNTRPAAGAHLDGLQQLIQPAADVILRGCMFDLRPDPTYTVPTDPPTGWTGALFADVTDGTIPDGDIDPTRVGTIRADWCYFRSPGNYSVVIGDLAHAVLTNCTIVSGTTAGESVSGTAVVSGYNNVDLAGAPLIGTAFIRGVDQVASTGGDSGATVLADLSDVDLAGAVTGNFLALDGSGKWEPKDAPAGGGGDGTPPKMYSTGMQSIAFGPCTGGPAPGGTPQTQPGSQYLVTIPGSEVQAGNLVHWEFRFISNGSDAQFDVASIVAGEPVNYYSGDFTPDQWPVGAGDLYRAGNYGQAQPFEIDWVVQSTDLDPADGNSFTLSLLYCPGGDQHIGLTGDPGQIGKVVMINYH